MPNKKILLSVLIIGVVGALAGSATWAYFQDIEFSDDNNFTAGTLDLSLANAPYTTQVSFPAGIRPGDESSTFQTIKNVGSLAGELDIRLSNLEDTESTGTTEYEQDTINGVSVGELGGNATMALWIDLDLDNDFDAGTDISLKSDGTFVNNNNSGSYYYSSIKSYVGPGEQKWDRIVNNMSFNDEYRVHILWKLPNDVGNTIQGDKVSFDIVYTLEQDQVD